MANHLGRGVIDVSEIEKLNCEGGGRFAGWRRKEGMGDGRYRWDVGFQVGGGLCK